ncbi:DUF6003 family protein [Streptomyces sp. NPDC048639]|uniref:DUF6003 family protein n=1 Tax=Streptomyces sp. NPDC048639 TaxID=3365581 RepID=UPI00371DC6C2
MAETAFLFALPEAGPHPGAQLAAVGRLDCLETPAVMGWLHAHDITAGDDRLRIVPEEAEGTIPEGAERLPVPLGEEEAARLRSACAPRAVAEVEAELRAFRHTNADRDRLISRAVDGGVPPHRIAQLTGLDPSVVADISRQ